jgi:hypothetical protein
LLFYISSRVGSSIMVLFLFEFCFELSWDPDFSEEGHIENLTQKHSPYLEMGEKRVLAVEETRVPGENH